MLIYVNNDYHKIYFVSLQAFPGCGRFSPTLPARASLPHQYLSSCPSSCIPRSFQCVLRLLPRQPHFPTVAFLLWSLSIRYAFAPLRTTPYLPSKSSWLVAFFVTYTYAVCYLMLVYVALSYDPVAPCALFRCKKKGPRMRAVHVKVIGPKNAYGPTRNIICASSFDQKIFKNKMVIHIIKCVLPVCSVSTEQYLALV